MKSTTRGRRRRVSQAAKSKSIAKSKTKRSRLARRAERRQRGGAAQRDTGPGPDPSTCTRPPPGGALLFFVRCLLFLCRPHHAADSASAGRLRLRPAVIPPATRLLSHSATPSAEIGRRRDRRPAAPGRLRWCGLRRATRWARRTAAGERGGGRGGGAGRAASSHARVVGRRGSGQWRCGFRMCPLHRRRRRFMPPPQLGELLGTGPLRRAAAGSGRWSRRAQREAAAEASGAQLPRLKVGWRGGRGGEVKRT